VPLALGQLARFAAAVGRELDRPGAARLADLLDASGGQDRIELTQGPIEHGTRVYFEVEEGVVKSPAGLRSRAETR